MPDDVQASALPIAQTGEAEWFPPTDDDNILAPPPSQRSGLHSIFFGADGIRAGWSIILFIAFFVGLVKLASLALKSSGLTRFAPHPGVPEHPLGILLFSHGTPFIAALISAFVLSLIERRRMGQYGLGRVRMPQFLAGSAWGFALFSLLILALRASHLLVFDGQVLHGTAIFPWGLYWLAAFLAVGFFEEYLTRGYLQFTFARGFAGIAHALHVPRRTGRVVGFWLAALFFSFLFGLGHKGNPGESPIGLWAAGLIGLVFAFSLWRTGSLWWAIGWHAAWDWAESFIYGTADSGNSIVNPLVHSHPQGSPIMSGGLTGPEGSVYVLVTIVLTAIVIAVTLKPQPGSPSDPAYSPNY